MPRYSYKLSNEKFVNPYTFIPVDFRKKQTQNINAETDTESELLTGMMECNIYAKTPLVVPDISSKREENKHPVYKFESTPDGTYIIPGSSLRGMLRSVYETASNSCFSTLKENTLLNTRNVAPKDAHAGLLINDSGEWKIYEATRYMLRIERNDAKGETGKKSEGNGLNPEVWSEKCPAYKVKRNVNGTFTKALEYENEIHSGEKVSFLVLKKGTEKISYMKIVKGKEIPCAPVAMKLVPFGTPQAKEGYLVLGELISNKHHESIFEKGTQKDISSQAIKDAMKGLDETVKIYRSNVNRMYGNTHYGYPEYEHMKERGCIPVWYIEKKQKVILSLAAMGRITFQKTLNEHINQKQPCQSRERLCKACRLFGMAQKETATGGRVRFTDAIMQNPEKMGTEMVPLAELGAPRPSYMPFYSTMTGKEKDGKGKSQIPGYDDPGITIRGRKYYWHSKDFKEINRNAPQHGKNAERNASMQIAEVGSKFKFEIYFDRITLVELRELVWAINFWENKPDGEMCHKLGHGKPIGLGSVKITVDKILCRSFSENDGYLIRDGMSLIDYSDEPFKDEPDKVGRGTIKALKKVCNFENAMKTRYPYINAKKIDKSRCKENDIANHKWFGENRSAGMSGHNNEIQLLPNVLAAQELRAYDIE